MNTKTWIRSIALATAGAALGWGAARLADSHDTTASKACEEHAGHEDGEADEEHDEHGEHGATSQEPGAIADSLLAPSGIALDTARAADLGESVALAGRVRMDPHRTFVASARFPGVLREWRLQPGEATSKGDLLALVESDATLEPYEIRAMRGGTLLRRAVVAGQAVAAGDILGEFAEPGAAMVELQAGPRDLRRLRPGASVSITAESLTGSVSGRIVSILPGVDRATQARIVRVSAYDRGGNLQEGLFVRGQVRTGSAKVAVSIPVEAIQTSGGRKLAYVREGGRFEERSVRTGREGDGRIEILEGVAAGEIVAARGSFVVKADLAKGEAGHDH